MTVDDHPTDTRSPPHRASEFDWLAGARCLVTGGAGFIGSHLVDALLAAKADVTVLDDLSTGREENLSGHSGNASLKVVSGTITSEETVRECLKNQELVFHLAAIPSVPRSLETPLDTGRANIWGTQLVLEHARLAGARRVILSASSAAYGDTPGEERRHEDALPRPLSPYAAQKVAGENLARAYARSFALDTVSLRYFNVFGPRQSPESAYAAVIPRFMQAALRGLPVPVHGDGNQKRDFTFVANAVLANLLASRTDVRLQGAVLNIGCGRSYSINELVAEISRLAGCELTTIHEPSRPGDVYFSRADIQLASEKIGYKPEIGFPEGLRQVYEVMKAEK